MDIATLVRRLDTAGLTGLLQGKALKYVRPSPASVQQARPDLTVGQYIKGRKAITAYQDIAKQG